MKKIILAIIASMGIITAQAQQDPQYTMYMFNQLALNPAYAGSRGCVSTTAHYRTQWVGVDGAPKTLSFGIHSPLRNERVSLGLQVVNDKIGLSNTTGLTGSYAYRIPISRKAKIAFGLQASVSSYTKDLTKAVTVQGNDVSFNQQPIKNLLLPNVGAGIYLNTPGSYVGVTIPHLVNNKLETKSGGTVTADQARQYRHLFLMAGTVIPLGQSVKMKPSGILKFAPNSPIQTDVNLSFLFVEALWLGVTWRSDVSTQRDHLTEGLDAIAMYEVNKRLRIGIAYDQTLTSIRTAQKGSYEFLLGYDFVKQNDKLLTPRYF
jgi:type IX secretion system PorP/SprF family membrane protein